MIGMAPETRRLFFGKRHEFTNELFMLWGDCL